RPSASATLSVRAFRSLKSMGTRIRPNTFALPLVPSARLNRVSSLRRIEGSRHGPPLLADQRHEGHPFEIVLRVGLGAGSRAADEPLGPRLRSERAHAGARRL